MKIISWNVANRIKKQSLQLAALISREPDIIGLQEIKNKTLPLWSKGLKHAGYKYALSYFDIHNRNVNYWIKEIRYYHSFPMGPIEHIDQSLLEIPWPERFVSVLIQNPE
ncbi:MAG: hypothetical protein GX818_07860 [Tissierellia bacterium]|nr:hypothetical protein [Tissierellia bacterium]